MATELPRIFLSYARLDAAIRDTVVPGLETFAEVWVDTADIPAGVKWREEIARAIAASDAVILLVSPRSVTSEPCIEEIETARELGKRVLCLQWESIDRTNLVDTMAALDEDNWVDLASDNWVERLHEGVVTDWERVHLHTVIATRLSQHDDPGTSGGLLSGGLLNRARALVAESRPEAKPEVTGTQRAFIRRSTRARWWRRSLAAALVLVVVVGPAIALRWYSSNAAAKEREAADQLERTALGAAAENPVGALRTALAAYALMPDRQRKNLVFEVLNRTHLAATFRALPGPVVTVASDAGGRTVFAASEDNSYAMWDLTDRRDPRRLGLTPDPAGPAITASALDAGGRTLALADVLGTVSIWRRDQTGLVRADLDVPIHAAGIRSLLLSDDGRTLAVATSEGVRLVGLGGDRSSAMRPMFGGPADAPAAFSPSGKMLVTVGKSSGTIWDLSQSDESARPVRSLPAALTATYRHDGRVLATGGSDKRVRQYALHAADKATAKAVTLPGQVDHVSYSSDGLGIVAVTPDRTVRRFDAATGAPVGQRFKARSDSTLPSAVSRGGNVMVTGAADGSVTVWDLTDRGQLARHGPPLPGVTARPMGLAYGPDDGLLAAGAGKEPMKLWRAAGPGWDQGQPIVGPSYVGSFAFGPGGRKLFAAGAGYPSMLLDVTGRPTRLQPPTDADLEGVNQAIGTQDGRLFATSNNSNIVVWQFGENGARRLGQLPMAMRAFAMAFDPDGKVLVMGAGNGNLEQGIVTFWDVSDPERGYSMIGKPIEEPTAVGTALDISPDGKIVAIGTNQDAWVLVDAETHEQIGPVHPGTGAQVVLFAGDGKLLITGGSDGRELMVWDVEDPARPQLLGLPLAGTGKSPVAVRRAGTIIATGVGDAAKIVELDLAGLIRQRDDAVSPACTAADGGLDEDSWRTQVQGLDYRDACDRHRKTTTAPVAATTSTPAGPPAKIAAESVKLGSTSISATIYFGQLDEVRRVVGLHSDKKSSTQAEDTCAETAIVRDVQARRGSVYFAYPSGWLAAEEAPDDAVTGPARTLRQQIVIPPPEADIASGYTLTAILETAGSQSWSTPTSISLSARNGRNRTWLFGDNQTVSCAVATR